MVFKSFPFTPDEWKRYVDDIFAKWRRSLDKLNEFLSHLNSLSEHIKFTIEIEKDNQLPFLDVLLTKKNGKLSHQVFRKQTHTDKYLHSNSHHHPKQKVGVIKTQPIPKKEKLQKTLEYPYPILKDPQTKSPEFSPSITLWLPSHPLTPSKTCYILPRI